MLPVLVPLFQASSWGLLSLGHPIYKEGGRSLLNHWEGSSPVAWKVFRAVGIPCRNCVQRTPVREEAKSYKKGMPASRSSMPKRHEYRSSLASPEETYKPDVNKRYFPAAKPHHLAAHALKVRRQLLLCYCRKKQDCPWGSPSSFSQALPLMFGNLWCACKS